MSAVSSRGAIHFLSEADGRMRNASPAIQSQQTGHCHFKIATERGDPAGRLWNPETYRDRYGKPEPGTSSDMSPNHRKSNSVSSCRSSRKISDLARAEADGNAAVRRRMIQRFPFNVGGPPLAWG